MRIPTVVIAVSCVLALGAGVAAAERPLAALVPADVSSYQEVNLDRILGRAPETAVLGELFGQMKSPARLRELFAEMTEGEKEGEEVAAVFELLRTADTALGPRIGWGAWAPNAQAMMASAMSGAGGSPLGMMPKVLVVADVRNAEALDALVAALAEEIGVPARVESRDGLSVTSFAEGMVELVRGEDWMALSFPPEPAKRAADLAAGKATGSLYTDPDYLKVMGRLPVDAMMVSYASADSVKQMLAAVNMMVPEAQFTYPSNEPLGVAAGVRVEDMQGRKMLTAYYTADLDVIQYLLDPTLTFQTVIMKPMLEQAKRAGEQGQQQQCEDNLWVLGEAFYAYADEHDGRLPEAETWVQDIRPYLEDEGVLKCPGDESEAETSYTMNPAASGLVLEEIEEPETVVMLYEPARHAGGANRLLADGCAEWLEGEPGHEAE